MPPAPTLVGVSYATATGFAKVYTIDLTADFNPTANAIRVVTSAATGDGLFPSSRLRGG